MAIFSDQWFQQPPRGKLKNARAASTIESLPKKEGKIQVEPGQFGGEDRRVQIVTTI